MVGLGTFPFAGGLVATLTSSRGGEMVAALAARYCAVVATRTSSAHAHVGVQFGWRPTRVALVASSAVGTGTDVIGSFASGLGPVMTTGTVC